MIEAALEGNAAVALVQLASFAIGRRRADRVLAMMSGSLRRLAAATRIIEQTEAQRHRITLLGYARRASPQEICAG